MTEAPSGIQKLVETFEQHIETYHSQQYNETQLRREFIDPFFSELGWDVTNVKGYAHAYKDVIHEDATDKQIDALVYKLYDLTDEEIKIVEGH
jgi:hypothetical protein